MFNHFAAFGSLFGRHQRSLLITQTNGAIRHQMNREVSCYLLLLDAAK